MRLEKIFSTENAEGACWHRELSCFGKGCEVGGEQRIEVDVGEVGLSRCKDPGCRGTRAQIDAARLRGLDFWV